MGQTYPLNGEAFPTSDWRDVFAPLNGIVKDNTGASFRVTRNGTQIAVAPGKAVVNGIGFREDQTTYLDLLNYGSEQPGIGQSRVDKVVLRLDPYSMTIGLTLAVGPVSATTNQTAATTEDDYEGYFDVPLARVFRNVTGSGTEVFIRDERTWSSPTVYTAGYASLAGFGVGTRWMRGSAEYIMTVNPNTGEKFERNSIVYPDGALIPLLNGFRTRPTTDEWESPSYSIINGTVVVMQGKFNFPDGAAFELTDDPNLAPTVFECPPGTVPAGSLSFNVMGSTVTTADGNSVEINWRLDIRNGFGRVRCAPGYGPIQVGPGVNVDVSGISYRVPFRF